MFIVVPFFIFKQTDYLTLAASLIGATFLILVAKGNPIGQVLTIVFSVLYGIISYRFAYYGEMITYLGMTMPMACFALISWLKNPYKNNKSQVKVNKLSKNEYILMFVFTVVVTIFFYYILKIFNELKTLLLTNMFMCDIMVLYHY